MFEKAVKLEFTHFIKTNDGQPDNDKGRIENHRYASMENLDWTFEIQQCHGVAGVSVKLQQQVSAKDWKQLKNTTLPPLQENAPLMDMAVRKH